MLSPLYTIKLYECKIIASEIKENSEELESGFYWLTEENKFRKYFRNHHLKNRTDVLLNFDILYDK